MVSTMCLVDSVEDKLGLWDIGVADRMLGPRVRTDRGNVGERGEVHRMGKRVRQNGEVRVSHIVDFPRCAGRG